MLFLVCADCFLTEKPLCKCSKLVASAGKKNLSGYATSERRDAIHSYGLLHILVSDDSVRSSILESENMKLILRSLDRFYPPISATSLAGILWPHKQKTEEEANSVSNVQ
jgi:hypothetical protein